MKTTSSSSGGVGFGGLLTLLFVTLKLTDVIDWSWWWVLCPVWIPIALALLCFLAYGVLVLCRVR